MVDKQNRFDKVLITICSSVRLRPGRKMGRNSCGNAGGLPRLYPHRSRSFVAGQKGWLVNEIDETPGEYRVAAEGR
jgi:hypothetical protein